MCTELILAILYFGIILGVNYFLFRLLFSYSRSILSSLRKKKIVQTFPEQNIPWELIDFPFKKSVIFSSTRFLIQDSLILGYYYREFSQEKKRNNEIEKRKKSYYFELLKQQYLSSSKEE
jgi:hypothetical protein